MRSLSFQESNYSNPKKYDDNFDNDIGKREDNEIQRILLENLNPDITVTDIGCGTGLGRTLIDNEYIGVDRLAETTEHCKNNLKGTFIHESAESYIKKVDSLNPIFLFSIDYLDVDVMEEYINKTEDTFIAVHCNRPYLHTISVYSGKEDVYYDLHPKEDIEARLELFDSYGGETFKLLGQEFYYVTIIKK